MADDVWSSGKDSHDGGAIDLGDPNYDDGLSVNEAFSVDNVFKMGIGVLMEQPALVILAAFNLFALQVVAQFLGPVVQFPTQVVLEGTGVDSTVADLVAQGAGAMVQLLLLPFQTLVTAGAIIAITQVIRTDVVSYASLYNQGSAMIRLLLFSLLVGLLMTLAVVAIMVPVGVGCWGLVEAGSIPMAVLFGSLGGIVGLGVLVYISLGFSLGTYAVCVDGLGPVEGLQVGWQAAEGGRITLFVTAFCLSLAGMVGCCACYVPAFVVQIVGMAGFAGAWLQYGRSEDEFGAYAFVQRTL